MTRPLSSRTKPTGNLDTETAGGRGQRFSPAHGAGKTLVIVTHDAALARGAHRIIQLKDGHILADDRRDPDDRRQYPQ